MPVVCPRMLARLYDPHLAAVWRGGDEGLGGLPEPGECPAAVSVLGWAGAGIRWHRVGRAILGYVPGRARGCSLVMDDDEPSVPSAGRSAAQDDLEQSPLRWR